MSTIYALYKGEDVLAVGTVKEIARAQKIKEKTVRRYGTPDHFKRTTENAKRLYVIEKGGTDD